MGIKGLWGILAPYSEKKPLHEITGETVAVDLSGWVCDSQNVTEYYVQPKLYLRNLFFRTIYLLLAEINPVFVLEGDAPELKRDVMASRNALQFRGAAPRTETQTSKKPDVARRRFKGVLKECESLLNCMGVLCIKGAGEAEATCAQLNWQGMVDAVVSQDSDCFAYGARRVYRNFSVSSAAGGGALAGSVDCYDADVVFQSNGFGRNKMVALALLCGCDYGAGACGSSINTAVAFLHTVPDNEVIPRILSWVTDVEHFEERARWVAVPGRCDRCGHAGRAHAKKGCPTCATHRDCHDTGHKAKVADVKRELSLRSRAVTCGMPFPEPKVMNEFLKPPAVDIYLNDMRRPNPNLIQFVKLMSHKLDWSERYCVEKFLPLLTKWHFQQHVPCRTIKPVKINKKRNPRGVPSYEVIWSDIDGEYDGLISDDQFQEDEDHLAPWTTTERQDLMRQYYPDIVDAYEESIRKPPKEKKTRAKKNTNENPDKPKRKYNRKAKKIDVGIANLSNSIKKIDLSTKTNDANSSKLNVSVSVNKLKRKLKTKAKQKTIDSFIASKRRKSDVKAKQSLRDSFRNISIYEPLEYIDDEINKENNHEINKEKENHYLSMLENDMSCATDIDLSDIVEKIVTRAPTTQTARVDNRLYKFVFDKYSTPNKPRKSVLNEIRNHCSTPNASPRRFSFKFNANVSATSIISKQNTSNFFDKPTEDKDAFEMSMDFKHKSGVVVLDCDTTVDYSLPDVCL